MPSIKGKDPPETPKMFGDCSAIQSELSVVTFNGSPGPLLRFLTCGAGLPLHVLRFALTLCTHIEEMPAIC